MSKFEISNALRILNFLRCFKPMLSHIFNFRSFWNVIPIIVHFINCRHLNFDLVTSVTSIWVSTLIVCISISLPYVKGLLGNAFFSTISIDHIKRAWVGTPLISRILELLNCCVCQLLLLKNLLRSVKILIFFATPAMTTFKFITLANFSEFLCRLWLCRYFLDSHNFGFWCGLIYLLFLRVACLHREALQIELQSLIHVLCSHMLVENLLTWHFQCARSLANGWRCLLVVIIGTTSLQFGDIDELLIETEMIAYTIK